MLRNKINLRYILAFGSYLFLIGTLFTIGYFIGKNHSSGIQESVTAISQPTEQTPAAVTPHPVRFRVILEDGSLRLYSDSDGISRVLIDTKISEESYPARDIAILKEGICFNGQEEALALMENFLS